MTRGPPHSYMRLLFGNLNWKKLIRQALSGKKNLTLNWVEYKYCYAGFIGLLFVKCKVICIIKYLSTLLQTEREILLKGRVCLPSDPSVRVKQRNLFTVLFKQRYYREHCAGIVVWEFGGWYRVYIIILCRRLVGEPAGMWLDSHYVVNWLERSHVRTSSR